MLRVVLLRWQEDFSVFGIDEQREGRRVTTDPGSDSHPAQVPVFTFRSVANISPEGCPSSA